MKNLNAYNRQQFQTSFENTAVYHRLASKYDRVCFDKFFETIRYVTPRQAHATSTVSAVPWYYLSYLDSSTQIVDLGCGLNFFKPYFANLHGIGAENNTHEFFGDEHDYVDDDFYAGHKSVYDSVFSINALHFHPLEHIHDIAMKFSDMLRPNGRGFLALNAARMIERSQAFTDMDHESLDQWIRSQFDNFPAEILVFDLDLSVRDAWMDGNIRIVFEK